MTTLFYFDDQGKWLSSDSKRSYSKLLGKDAYIFMTSEASKSRHYVKVNEKKAQDETWMEVDLEGEKSICKDDRRERYVDECCRDSGVVFLSLETVVGGNDLENEPMRIEDMIEDTTVDIEKEVSDKIQIEILRSCLSYLSEEEMDLINSLYLSDSPLTFEEYGQRKGLTRQGVNRRKETVLKKLKILLKNFVYKARKVAR